MNKLKSLSLTTALFVALAACGNENDTEDAAQLEDGAETTDENIEESNDTTEALEESRDDASASAESESNARENEDTETTNTEATDTESEVDFSGTGEIKYVQAIQGTENEITYKYEDGEAKTRVAITRGEFEALNTDRESIEAESKQIEEDLKEVSGLTYEMEFTDDMYIQTLTTDYDAFDYQAASQTETFQSSGDLEEVGENRDVYVDMNVAHEEMIAAGFEVVE